jgi:hypothetical protein
MDKPVGNILKSELTATCPQIAIGVPIALEITIYGRHQSKTPDIKLTVFVEKRLLDILLDDVTPFNTIHSRVLYQSLDVIKIFAHLYSTAPVGVLSRLDDPQLLSKLGQLVKNCGLARIRSVVIELLELEELRIAQTLLDMESKRQALEVITSNCLVIHFHVIVDGFLVR